MDILGNMVNILTSVLQWLSTKRFPDGSSVGQIGRDEVLYEKGNGQSVVAYVFITGGGYKFDRILVKDSVKKWGKPNSDELILEDEQEEIARKIAIFFKREKLGILIDGEEHQLIV
jgi:hypothetical protein